MSPIIIRITVLGFLNLHGGFHNSVRCSVGSIIVCVICFHVLLFTVVVVVSR